MIFYLLNGSIIERLKYRRCFRSLKVQNLFYRARLKGYVLLFQVGGFIELYGPDAALAGKHFGCRVRPGFRGMDAVAGFPKAMAGKVINRLIALGCNTAFIAQGDDGRHVKNRYVRELYRVEA
ncbi:MAG: hypothetical protein WCQ99_16685 [Pseudomonadota bacterium]